MFILGGVAALTAVIIGLCIGVIVQRAEKRDLVARMLVGIPVARGEFVILGKSSGEIYGHAANYQHALEEARKTHPYDLGKVTIYFLHPEKVRTLVYEGNLN